MTEDERRAIEADCERLIKLYANLGDAQAWPAVAALYTADARFARPSQPEVFVEGREAILASFLARPPRAQRHVVANVVVDVEDAHHACAFSVIVLYQRDTAPLVGTFTDKLVRTGEGWRFAERVGGLDFRP
jgi:3-phenylpropionate/cinnamic acid dioxygenase small subunit